MMDAVGRWLYENVAALLAIVLTVLLAIDTRRRFDKLEKRRREDEATRRAVREALARFRSDGDKVVSRATLAISTAGDPDFYGDDTPSPEAFKQATDLHETWTADVARYLRETPTLGVEYEHRFKAQVTTDSPKTLISRESLEFVIAIVRARQDRLDAFIAELRADNGPTTRARDAG